MQLVSVSGKTGVFHLANEGREGQIYLKDGKIVHASTSRLSGEEAVYELATWQTGEFQFTQGTETAEATIDKSNTNLLMEAARRMDEWSVLSKRIPSTRHIPVFCEDSASTSLSFSPQEWEIICRVDGRRSVEEIALALGKSPFDVAKNLYGLLTGGILTLREDFLKPFLPKLQVLGTDELQKINAEIDTVARQLLGTGTDDQGLDRAVQLSSRQAEAGRGVDALIDLIRAHEHALDNAKGAAACEAFAEQTRELLGQLTA